MPVLSATPYGQINPSACMVDVEEEVGPPLPYRVQDRGIEAKTRGRHEDPTSLPEGEQKS